MPVLTTTLVALLLAGGGGSPDPLSWDGHSLRRATDTKAHLAFPVPLTQTLIEARHFPEATMAQMTDVLMLSGPQGYEVEIGVFRRTADVTLDKFLDTTLAVVRAGQHTEMPWVAQKERVPAKLIELPRTGQQFAQRVAVFFVPGGRAVAITCWNAEDRRSLAVFEAVLAGLEVLP